MSLRSFTITGLRIHRFFAGNGIFISIVQMCRGRRNGFAGRMACFDLFHLVLLSFLEQMLPLNLNGLSFSIHDRFQFFEMSQFDFQLFDLQFHHLSNG